MVMSPKITTFVHLIQSSIYGYNHFITIYEIRQSDLAA